jgi:hypothetical protein
MKGSSRGVTCASCSLRFLRSTLQCPNAPTSPPGLEGTMTSRLLACVVVTLFFLLSVSSKANPASTGTQSVVTAASRAEVFPDTLAVFAYAEKRPHCNDKYPGEHRPASCQTRIGSTACGGPDECSCGSNERLVTFHCGNAYYHLCEKDVFCKH